MELGNAWTRKSKKEIKDTIDSLRGLYSEEPLETEAKSKPEKKKRVAQLPVPTEDQEQILLATWLTKKGVKFYAIPNGGFRNYAEAVKLKRSGVIPGIPDLCIPIASGSYHGLYIELKRRRGGQLSDAQAYWLTALGEEGYKAVVARGFDEAKEIVIDYLALTPKAA